MLYATSVSCGFPSPAEDYVDRALDLNELLIAKPSATFFVKAKGESMIGAGIFEGDLLIIDRSVTPKSGQIVLAVVSGEFTLKRLVKEKNEIWLYPENSKNQPLKITPEMEFEIWGVALHCIHKL